MPATISALPSRPAVSTVSDADVDAWLRVSAAGAILFLILFVAIYAHRVRHRREAWDKAVLRRDGLDAIRFGFTLSASVGLICNVVFGWPTLSATTRSLAMIAAGLWAA